METARERAIERARARQLLEEPSVSAQREAQIPKSRASTSTSEDQGRAERRAGNTLTSPRRSCSPFALVKP
ncbi:unnamed protein product [Pleuronectes platessa]|uniref:Uncharacterized protein n=1 Tax=Pleuronectes platessa TaxID=8262 RepID=A0A9N7UUY3_PLEPL|nr:unnamed protein product [Pleuronectes platessa]